MSSFPRPLLAAALASSSSSSAASSSLSFLRQSSSTSLSQVRYFSSTPSCRKTARDVEREIQAEQTKAREMLETQQHQNTQMRNAYATSEGRKRVNEVAVPQAIYFNPRSFFAARKEPGYTLSAYLQLHFALAKESLTARGKEFGMRVDPLPRGLWETFLTWAGIGKTPGRQKLLLENLVKQYTDFRQAELKGDTSKLATISEAPVKEAVIRSLNARPRSDRLKNATWEIVKHVDQPRLLTFFKIPFFDDKEFTHALVRLHTVQRVTVPAGKKNQPPVAREQTLVENLLFERRDWLRAATGKSGAWWSADSLYKGAPYKLKRVVEEYDDVAMGSEALSKPISEEEMKGL